MLNQFWCGLTGRKQNHKMFNSHCATLHSEDMFLFLDCDVTVGHVRQGQMFRKRRRTVTLSVMEVPEWPKSFMAKLTSCTWS